MRKTCISFVLLACMTSACQPSPSPSSLPPPNPVPTVPFTTDGILAEINTIKSQRPEFLPPVKHRESKFVYLLNSLVPQHFGIPNPLVSSVLILSSLDIYGKTEIHLIVAGDGYTVMQKGNPYAAIVEGLLAQGVQFYICAYTMVEKKISPDTLIDGVYVSESAVSQYETDIKNGFINITGVC